MYVNGRLLNRMIRLVNDLKKGKEISTKRLNRIMLQLEDAWMRHDDGNEEGKHFAVIRWGVDDVKEALRQGGYKTSRENVRRVLASRTARTLEDVSIGYGWEILDSCFYDVDDLEKRKGA